MEVYYKKGDFMKRSVSLLLCIVLALLMCVAFAGCDFIDEMRADHGILSEDKSTINLNSKIYRRLPNDKEFFFKSYFGYYGGERVDVTDSDVPVLLKDDFSYVADYDITSDIIRLRLTEGIDPLVYEMSFDYYYCSEEDYEKYLKAYNENELDSMGIGREYMIANYGVSLTLDVMNEDFTNEIMGYLEDDSKMTSELFEELYNSQDYMRYLSDCIYKCDKDGILAQGLGDLSILKDNKGDAYLMNYTTEKAVKLSEKVSVQLDDMYFDQYLSYYE